MLRLGTVIQMAKGDILGHEFCGVVDEIGSEVKGIKKGGRYVASFQIACGDCFFCKQKLSSQCERTNSNTTEHAMYGGQTAGMFGYSHFTGGFAGGQAEYVRVPLGDVNLLPIPDDVPDEKALYLSDVLATSYNCVKDTAVYKGDEVAIWGAGPIGQMCGIFAINEGASKIIFVDEEKRLELVKSKWPAEHQDKLHLVDFKKLSFGVTNKPTVVSTLKELCGGRGPDVALECAAGEYPKGWMHKIELAIGAETDTSELVNEMIESVRNFGRCGITGVYVGYVSCSPFYGRCTQLLTVLDKSLQHRISDGEGHSTDWKRASPSSPVLGEADGGHQVREARSSPNGFPPYQLGRFGQGLLQVQKPRGWYPEDLRGDEALIP